MSQPQQRRFMLPESELPTHLYNIAADLPEPLRRRSTRDPPADRPGRPGATLPDGADQAGGQHRALHRDPGACARGVPDLAALTAHPGAGPGACARYAGAHLLQVRGRLARPAATSRTPPSRRPTTTRRRASSAWSPRRGPGSGEARSPLPAASSASSAWSSWSRQLRAEAVPAQLHGDLGARGDPQPVDGDERRPHRSWRRSRIRPAAWGSPSARRSRRRPPTRTRNTRWAASSITCCCTRP